VVFVISTLFVCAAVFLLCLKYGATEMLPPRLRGPAIAVSKYLVAAFVGTYGSVAIAAVVASPLLLFSPLVPPHSSEGWFSALLDRSYFPLQALVAFILGYTLSTWLRQGHPAFIWVWPVTQVAIALALFRPLSVVQDFWAGVWQTYFNWQCGCSITLVQWAVMSPLYTSLAFSAGAFLSGRRRLDQTATARAPV